MQVCNNPTETIKQMIEDIDGLDIETNVLIQLMGKSFTWEDEVGIISVDYYPELASLAIEYENRFDSAGTLGLLDIVEVHEGDMDLFEPKYRFITANNIMLDITYSS